MIVNPGLRRSFRGVKNSYVMNIDFTNSLQADRAGVTCEATRASTRTYFDGTGTQQTAAVNEFPREYDPTTLACIGRSFWEARTNSSKTNMMTGAATGTPGTLPTDFGNYNPGALTREIVAISTEDGITYIEIRVSGTLGAPSQFDVHWSSGTYITASVGETWTNSAYVKLVAGSLTNVTACRIMIDERAGGAYLAGSSTTFTPTSSALRTQRPQHTRLLDQATVDRILPYLNLVLAAGTIDITLRIGMPQLENIPSTATSDKASPVIATSGAAATRAADVCSLTAANFSSWYNQSGGTFSVVARIDYVPVSGLLPKVAIVQSAFASVDSVRIGDISNVAGAARAYCYAFNSSVAQFDLSSVNAGYNVTIGVPFRRTVSYETNNAQACSDRATLLTDTSCTPPTVDRLYIGCVNGTAQFLNGWIQSITYYNRPLNELITRI